MTSTWTAEDSRRPTVPAPPVVKVCRCGREHTAAGWLLLPYVGVMQGEDGPIELRNCSCRSTIAMLADPTHDDEAERDMEHERAERDAEWRERGW